MQNKNDVIDASVEIVDDVGEMDELEKVDDSEEKPKSKKTKPAQKTKSSKAAEEKAAENKKNISTGDKEEVPTDEEEIEELVEDATAAGTGSEEKPKTKAKKRKVTKGDIIEAFKEKEELRMRDVLERSDQSLKWHIIQDYFHTKKIGRGTVISVEETTSGMVVAVVNFKDFRVVVPASEFFVTPIATEEGVSEFQRIRREKQVIVKSLGAEIEFVIVHANQEYNKETKEKEYIVLASRKQALAKQVRYYFSKQNGIRRVEPGKIIRNAPIVAVGKEALLVSVCGIDKIMTKAQLSYKFLGSLIDYYHVGDRIDVAVLDVVDKENNEVDIKVSHKQTQLEQFKRNVANCSVGGMYRGTITIIKDNNIQLYLTDIDVPAFSKVIKLNNIEELPSAGDSVLIVARKIVPEKGLVLGTIIRKIKK